MAFYDAYYVQNRPWEEHNYVIIYKASYANRVLYPLASSLPKLSMCALYLRIFGTSNWARCITYGKWSSSHDVLSFYSLHVDLVGTCIVALGEFDKALTHAWS